MKVLLIGEGGREDALAWALSRSPLVRTLRCAPGSAGIGRRAACVSIRPTDVGAIEAHAVAEGYDLVVVGPEAPLVAGLADRLQSAGLAVFGPSAAAAEIEGSKVFSKEFMARHGVPTARFEVFSDADAAARYLRSAEVDFPIVVKADGLAAGKGVVIAPDRAAAEGAARAMLEGGAFGSAGARVVIEACLEGREASFFVLADGARYAALAPCQDYKRALDGDRGPNTGGMGSFSPAAHVDAATVRRVEASVVEPTLTGLAGEGRPYRGVLFIGLMLTADGPMVLEYNARFGDPETQALLPRLDGDWVPWLLGAARGSLPPGRPAWRPEASVCVVLAAGGYPGPFATGQIISGLDGLEAEAGVEVFHAGTDRRDGNWITRGGRVLGVTALGADLAAARAKAYAAADRITWDGKHARTDIARDALAPAREGDAS